MATRRKYTSKRKKQTLISPKSFKWILGLFLLLCTIVFVYQKKDMLLYYLGFKTKNTELTANQRKLEDKRINDIVANHEGKIFGIDVSQYQGTIDWGNLEAIEEQFEIKFVVVRATAGSKKADRNFKKIGEIYHQLFIFRVLIIIIVQMKIQPIKPIILLRM